MSYPRQSILFISGLEKSINETNLYSLFNDFPISYVKIAKDHNTRESFGYAFVGFKSHSKAEEAIKKLNYTKLGLKTIRISWYNRDSNNPKTNPNQNLFVKKLPKGLTHQEFHDKFATYGNIVSAKLQEDEEGEFIGFGFVLYDSPESVQKAINEANGNEWNGKKIYVGEYIKNKPKSKKKFNNIYVKNIPKSFSDKDIAQFFSAYGPLGSTLIKEPRENELSKLPDDKKNQILSHKYAFICYENFDDAEKAVNKVPYYKINDKDYNDQVDKLSDLLRKQPNFKEEHIYRGAVFLIENVQDYHNVFTDAVLLTKSIEELNNHLKANDDNYIVKDKKDRMDCCQALKKKERAKKIKSDYEKIKKSIKEKYKFCNLYIKNLPDSFDDEALRKIFVPFGEIRSCKTVRKELFTSYLGIKRSVKIFGFVCFFDREHARNAKSSLHGTQIGTSGSKLFVDYHQNKQERNEFLKLRFMNSTNKTGAGGQKGMKMDMRMPMGGMPLFGNKMHPGMFHPGMNMIGGFPQNMMMNRNQYPQMMNPQMINPQPMNLNMPVDKNTRRDYYGDRLFSKISSLPQFSQMTDFFSKIVGIFLELDDGIIERLINDEAFLVSQVNETYKLLIEKSGN